MARSRASRRAALRRALSNPKTRRKPRRKRRNAATSAKQSKGMQLYQGRVREAKKRGIKTYKKSSEQLARAISEHKARSSRKRAGRKRHAPVRGAVKTARRRASRQARLSERAKHTTRRKAASTRARKSRSAAVKRTRRSTTLGMLRSERTRAQNRAKSLTKRIDKWEARKNPGFNAKKFLRGTGFVFGGLIGSNFMTAIANKAMANTEAGTREKVAEYVAPALLAGGAYWLGQNKNIKWMDDKDAMAAIGGVVGAVALRNVQALKDGVAKIPGIGKLIEIIEDLPSKVGLGDYHHGAGAYLRVEEDPDFGMGEYVYTGGMDGMGRYVADPFQVGQGGMGEYIQTGPIGIPAIEVEGDEIAAEAGSMAGLGATDLHLESIVPDAGQKIIRALPEYAQHMADTNIGEILGESRQLPGSLLVGVSVAGRDMKMDTGPITAMDYGPAPIRQAENIQVSPQGVFSRSVFTPVIPGGLRA